MKKRTGKAGVQERQDRVGEMLYQLSITRKTARGARQKGVIERLEQKDVDRKDD